MFEQFIHKPHDVRRVVSLTVPAFALVVTGILRYSGLSNGIKHALAPDYFVVRWLGIGVHNNPTIPAFATEICLDLDVGIE